MHINALSNSDHEGGIKWLLEVVLFVRVFQREMGRVLLEKIDQSSSFGCVFAGVSVCAWGEKLDCHPPRRELIQCIHHTLACQFTKRGGGAGRALNERWSLTPTQTQEIPPPSNTIMAVIVHSRCRL